MTVHIVPIDTLTEAQCAELDQVMVSARIALTGRTGQLDRISERKEEAGYDPYRWLYAALDSEGHPVAFLDAEAHYPDLETVTVAQLAVDRSVRHRGIGRTLVQTVARRCQGSGILWMSASTRIRSADGFWTSLGFESDGEGRFRLPIAEMLQPAEAFR